MQSVQICSTKKRSSVTRRKAETLKSMILQIKIKLGGETEQSV